MTTTVYPPYRPSVINDETIREWKEEISYQLERTRVRIEMCEAREKFMEFAFQARMSIHKAKQINK